MGERRYDAVFFDAGHTLLWAEPSPDETWSQSLEEHGYRVSAEEVVRRTGVRGPEINRNDIRRAQEDAAGQLLPPFPVNMEEEAVFQRRFDALVLERLGVPVTEGLIDTVQRRFAEDPEFHVYDDVEPALQRLRDEGYRLGVISNASHDLPGILDRVGLTPRFDAITYSFEAGAQKPDPAIFKTALRRLGVEAARAVHVGDTYEKDVVGALRAGIVGILLDRDSDAERADCAVVKDFHELLKWLDQSPEVGPSRY